MATSITTIQSTDLITNSRADINNNFDSLLNNKIETDVLDTDTTLAANSDSKIATQKAVKAYVDAGGNTNASTTNKGIVEEATQAEVDAGTATGGTGARLFVNPSTLKGISAPVVRTYVVSTTPATSSTRFDITNPSGTTFRYTYDGTGTDPVINSTTFPTGSIVAIFANGTFNVNNNGVFIVTGSGTNYFEVTNASGVVESDKALNTRGYINVSKPQTWSKPAGLKYITVEGVGGGGGGAGADTDSVGALGFCGGGAGWTKKTIAETSLASTETIIVGVGGTPGYSASTATTGIAGYNTTFGSHITANGGSPGTLSAPGAGGSFSGGDYGVAGQPGQLNPSVTTLDFVFGGDSFMGFGGMKWDDSSAPSSTTGYGGGGAGGSDNGSIEGGAGAPGIVIVTEYYV